MTNAYHELKQKQQKEFNEFPIGFAFSNKQFDDEMIKLGLSPQDTDKVSSIGAGGFIRKSDSQAFREMLDKRDQEMKEAIDGDLTGEGFIYQMFLYELNNHEYGYTWELEPTLDALDLTMEDVKKDKRLLHGLELARKKAGEE